MEMQELIEILKREGCSCVVANKATVRIFHKKGVKDIFELLENDPAFLKDSMIADKVVGKGAAALMAAGGVREVFAAVISTPALKMLESAGIPTSFVEEVANIINRQGTGICPVEALCLECVTPDECVPRIAKFLNGLSSQPGSN